jgi:hypothetical protein
MKIMWATCNDKRDENIRVEIITIFSLTSESNKLLDISFDVVETYVIWLDLTECSFNRSEKTYAKSIIIKIGKVVQYRCIGIIVVIKDIAQ